MNLFFRWFAILSFTFFNVCAEANEQAAYLRRISLLLQGAPPENRDLNEAAHVHASRFKRFLESKIDLYMQSGYFVEKMRLRYLELLGMRITPRVHSELFFNREFDIDDSGNYLNQSLYNTSLDLFLSDAIRENKSWDHLLTGNSYRISKTDNDWKSELDFYQDVFEYSEKNFDGDELKLISKTKAQKNALAGVITTPRFYSRYFSSLRNENRKKSAALFRVFLCDSMRPEQNADENILTDLKKKAVNQDPGEASETAIMSDSARHGALQSCARCHNKLDPLGKVFSVSSNRPDLAPTAGVLTYPSLQKGPLVRVPFSDMASMAKAIVSRKEYAECQVTHFWNWFVGDDVAPSKALKQSLVRDFNSNGRKPKFLIKQVLLKSYPQFVMLHSKMDKRPPSFENKFNRMMQNFDFFNSIVSQLKTPKNFLYSCPISKLDFSGLGLRDPNTGTSQPQRPNLTYYQTLFNCARNLRHFTEPLVDVGLNTGAWNKLPRDERRKFINKIVLRLIGEGVYSTEVTDKLTDNVLNSIQYQEEAELSMTINTAVSLIVLSEEYLTL